MTLQDIAMFKHFLESKGMEKIYIELYKRYRIKTNPEAIEEFFATADPANVCLSAFYFVAGSTFGFDYWHYKQNEWDAFRVNNAEEFPICDVLALKGKAIQLRKNYDTMHWWKVQPRFDTAKRLGIELPTTEKAVIAKAYKNQNIRPEVVEELGADEQVPDDDPLSDFESIDLSHSDSHVKLKDDEVSFNMRNNGYRLTFNKAVSDEMRNRGGYDYVELMRNKQGDIVVLLNDKRGVSFQGNAKKCNCCVSNKMFIINLSVLLGIKEEYTILKIRQIGKTDDYVAYQITKR